MFPVEDAFLSLDPVFFGFLVSPFLEPEVWDRFDDFLPGSITGSLIAGRRVVEDRGGNVGVGSFAALISDVCMALWSSRTADLEDLCERAREDWTILE